MTPTELRAFYFAGTNFSPSAIEGRKVKRYVVRSRIGDPRPSGKSADLGIFDLRENRFLTAAQVKNLPAADAIAAEL